MFKIFSKKIKVNKIAISSGCILLMYLSICILDSIHFKTYGASIKKYNNNIVSLLDISLYPIGTNLEKSYTKPFAKYKDDRGTDITKTTIYIFLKSLMLSFFIIALSFFGYMVFAKIKYLANYKIILLGYEYRFVRFVFGLFLFFATICITLYELSLVFHICGTDKIGHDIFYQCLKSIRTSILIGVFTLIIMLPIAVVMGISAGFFGGKVDDLIQYIYTTISSIPGVLLIAAAILSLQVFISNNSSSFVYLIERSDLRLLSLCFILGGTAWTSLCRIIRAETLKIRELEFIDSAICLGVSKPNIIFRHILPNLQHIILITLVLDFSGLILAEAILSYGGIGVSPTTMSWGNMINSARLELAREPAVWWPIFSAFSFMLVLVLSANLFADQVRDIIDPRHADI
ncbi:MAG: ABC transporter permease [Legionellales bacterium]|nr:ABC transporter permease [Legionellales bacterium]